MPFTTTATWPALANRTASAADVNNKFAWLEGHRYPHSGGIIANNTYDIGSAAYLWNKGIFSTMVVGGETLGADVPGRTINAWATVDTSTSNPPTRGFNISSVALHWNSGTGDRYGYTFNLTTPMQSDKYAVIGSSEYRTNIFTQAAAFFTVDTWVGGVVHTVGAYFSVIAKE